MSDIIYEHLGSPIVAEMFQKPTKFWGNKPHEDGLWGSRIGGYYTWRDWVSDNNFHTDRYLDDSNAVKFKLKDDAKILVIDGTDIECNKAFWMFSEYDPSELEVIKKQLTTDQDVFLKKALPTGDEDHDMLYQTTEYFALDWNYILSTYDGIELIHGKQYAVLHWNGFNMWDCDSICIWNNVIEIIN